MTPDPAALARLLAVVDRLLDPDVVQPFPSAWELDGWRGEGEELHAELRAARDAFR